jgi:type II secretory pathway pseudopilin PulG
MNPQIPNPRSKMTGFTLVELLAVILIMALLIVLILGAVHRAQRASRISKTKADLATISTALEQYHSDFKVYPGLPNPPPGSTITIKRTILAAALIGPGDDDGAPGPGFRTVINPATGAADPNAKKWDAYLSPEHFQVQKFTRGGADYWAMLDYFGNPIRYYPKRKNLSPKLPNILVDSPAGNAPSVCIFDARDGEHPQTGVVEIGPETLQVVLGDQSCNNSIDGDENLTLQGNFILSSPGPDAIFTLYSKSDSQAFRRQKASKSDDIFNFER